MEGPPSQEPEEYRPPPHQLATWLVLGAAVVFVLGLFAIRGEHRPDTSRAYAAREPLPDAEPVLLPPEPMDDEYVPCSDCHEGEEINRTRRELEDEHDQTALAHGDLWCLQCHDAEDRDKLRLADGELVAFEESWRLCTQCHGEKLADWRVGVHGKRTGHWRGPKEYQPCVACHAPHSPPFAPLEPKPMPLRPAQIGRDGNAPLEVAREAP